MFYGYESEAEMREFNPAIADTLISLATPTTEKVCSPGKQCVGSLDGKNFLYSDGSTDTGIETLTYRAELGGNVFKW